VEGEKEKTYEPSGNTTMPSTSRLSLLSVLLATGTTGLPSLTPRASNPVVVAPPASYWSVVDLYVTTRVFLASAKERDLEEVYGVSVKENSCERAW